jgi:group II intron reverse transcriptase/maturase
MMNETGQSDNSAVPEKSANKGGHNSTPAEQMEGKGLTKGNEHRQNTRQTQGWGSVNNALRLVHEKAKADKKMRFTALMHHIYDIENLRAAYFGIKRDAAPGVDGVTWQDYGEKLEERLQKLSDRLKRGAYRPKPVRRVYIPKADGRKRPLGVTATEDKLVQRAAVTVMNAIYEADFLGFSYGFRPGRHQHKALDALHVGITKKKVNWVLDADISDFFNTISWEWLIKFVEHRIADKRVIRLIQKWLKAGVLEDGEVTYTEEGTPQGGSASPLMANIYLHYVYDLWVQQWRTRRAQGEVIVVRYADDTIVGFQHKSEAEQFLKELAERLRKFGLELHPTKTRLIEFGRFADRDRKKRGQGKPETFDFLGFTHVCGTTKEGRFTVKRQTMRKRLHAKVKEISTELRRRMHEPIFEVGQWLRKVVQGFNAYHGVPFNIAALSDFRYRVYWHWRRTLMRRSQKARFTWEQMNRLIDQWLPKPRICHPHPIQRFGVIPR